jgi:ankyrin repeat protein
LSQATQPLLDELVGNAHGNLVRVREILDEHPELLNEKATWNETPIQAATQMGNRKIIDELIDRGAPVDFFTALALGRKEQIEDELKRNPAAAQARGIHDLAPLYFAAIGAQTDAAQRLIAAGADVNATAQAGAPIHGAVIGGEVEMVRLLLDHGADPSLRDYAGRDARSLALEIKRQDIAEMLSG